MSKKSKKKYELAVLFDDHTWEDDYWEIAQSPQEAEAKLTKKLAEENNQSVSHVTVICEQEIEEGDEEFYE